ncbi:MAG TPA: hypothetical protein PLE48_00505 [Thiobacillus sp.]|nr:hypothetical protein [Thiobacillus sp.]HQT68890.1 hypothetical protein [Thiobacillus sp.]
MLYSRQSDRVRVHFIGTKSQTPHPAQTLYIRLQGTLDPLKRSPVQKTPGAVHDLPAQKMQERRHSAPCAVLVRPHPGRVESATRSDAPGYRGRLGFALVNLRRRLYGYGGRNGLLFFNLADSARQFVSHFAHKCNISMMIVCHFRSALETRRPGA